MIKKLVICFLLVFSVALPCFSLAQNPADSMKTSADKIYGKENVKKLSTDPVVIIGQLIREILTFVGIIFFLLVIYGGSLWMFSLGNEDRVKDGKGIIINAAIGLGLIFLSYSITYYLTQMIIDKTLVDTTNE